MGALTPGLLSSSIRLPAETRTGDGSLPRLAGAWLFAAVCGAPRPFARRLPGPCLRLCRSLISLWGKGCSFRPIPRLPFAGMSVCQPQKGSGFEPATPDERRGAQLAEPQGPGVRAGSRCCQFRGKRSGRGPQPDRFVPGETWVPFSMCRQIARKGRVNGQEMRRR